jgi:hypothetical protein
MNELLKKVAIGIGAGLVSLIGAIITDLDAKGDAKFDWKIARPRYIKSFLGGFLPAIGFTGAAGALGVSA